MVLLLPLILFFNGCDTEEEAPNASVQKIVGTYFLTDNDGYNGEKNYSVSLNVASKTGSDIEINNFGDIMHVPVKANIEGDQITIPAQTFKGKTMTITISGSGTVTNEKLEFDYIIETDDRTLESFCVATKLNE